MNKIFFCFIIIVFFICMLFLILWIFYILYFCCLREGLILLCFLKFCLYCLMKMYIVKLINIVVIK